MKESLIFVKRNWSTAELWCSNRLRRLERKDQGSWTFRRSLGLPSRADCASSRSVSTYLPVAFPSWGTFSIYSTDTGSDGAGLSDSCDSPDMSTSDSSEPSVWRTICNLSEEEKEKINVLQKKFKIFLKNFMKIHSQRIMTSNSSTLTSCFHNSHRSCENQCHIALREWLKKINCFNLGDVVITLASN